MIINFSHYILEKSSLTVLGVPNEVMKDIQINYEIPSDFEWEKIKYKKDLHNELKKDENAIFILISNNRIIVITNKNKTYTEQKYTYDDSGWGGYDIGDITNKTYSQIIKYIPHKVLMYKYKTDKFQTIPKSKRNLQKELKDFDETTEDFKIYTIRYFNKIIRKIYGKKHDEVMKKIASNMSNMKSGMNTDDLLTFLNDNKKLAEMAKEYQVAKQNDDILRLSQLEKQYNSLTIFDEYLIKFEVAYSEKFNYRITLKSMIDSFGLMQTQTAFLYFLYTGKVKDMKLLKFESFSQEMNDPQTYSTQIYSDTNEPEVVMSKLKKKKKKFKDKIYGDSEYDQIDDEYPWDDNSWKWS